MIPLSASTVADVMQGTLYGSAEISANAEFQFDSREVKPGDVFLALRGEKADGHEFVSNAVDNGAVLSIVTKPVSGTHIVVADVLDAIGALALYVRHQLANLKVVGITGSQGKTTTKDMLYSILKDEGKTVAARGSFNNDLGVPLTLLRCDTSTKFCIVEMGARHGGDISSLTKIALPDVGAVLKVGNAHIGEFGSREKIALAKGELVAGLKSGAIAVLGTYDEFTPKMPISDGVRKMTFGVDHNCDVRAADIEFRGGFAHFDLVTPEAREGVEPRVLGLHQIPNALPSPDQPASKYRHHHPDPRRTGSGPGRPARRPPRGDPARGGATPRFTLPRIAGRLRRCPRPRRPTWLTPGSRSGPISCGAGTRSSPGRISGSCSSTTTCTSASTAWPSRRAPTRCSSGRWPGSRSTARPARGTSSRRGPSTSSSRS